MCQLCCHVKALQSCMVCLSLSDIRDFDSACTLSKAVVLQAEAKSEFVNSRMVKPTTGVSAFVSPYWQAGLDVFKRHAAELRGAALGAMPGEESGQGSGRTAQGPMALLGCSRCNAHQELHARLSQRCLEACLNPSRHCISRVPGIWQPCTTRRQSLASTATSVASFVLLLGHS